MLLIGMCFVAQFGVISSQQGMRLVAQMGGISSPLIHQGGSRPVINDTGGWQEG